MLRSFALVTLAITLTVAAIPASAETPTDVYNFKGGTGDVSGPIPYGYMAQGRDGNLYSAAPNGGANGNGGIFMVTPSGAETVIYSFTSGNGPYCQPGLTLGNDGNFYGVCYGYPADGILYKVTPTGTFTLLHAFTGGADGGQPGGYNSGNRLNTVEAYNPATDTWTEKATLLNGKTEISAGLVGTTIVAADGYTSSGDTGDNEAYDVSTNTWTSLAADPTARNVSCSGVIASLLYGADGNNNGGGPISVMESFSLAKNKWITLTAMPQTVTAMGSAVYGGQLYCFGGGNSAVPPNNTVYNYVQIYQP